MTLTCITNKVPGLRSCTVKNAHQTGCDGSEYQQSDESYKRLPTGRTCSGCIPREATNGVVCYPCYQKVGQALSQVYPWWQALQGVDRAIQRDTAGIRTKWAPPIPITPVALAIDELESWFRNYPGDLDMWVASEQGAREAVMFAKTALAAFRAHPIAEKPSRVLRVNCGECGQMNLVRMPPSSHGEALTVRCTTVGCARTLSQDDYEIAESAAARRIA